jgi:hypothetical protein
MPRVPKPYPYKGWFRTNAGGKRGHPLCRIEEGMANPTSAVRTIFHQLWAGFRL